MPHAKSITKFRRLIFMNQVLTTYQEIYLVNQSRDAVRRYLTKENHLKDMILGLASSPKAGQWLNKHGMKKATEIEATFLKIETGSPLHKIASEIRDDLGGIIGLVYTVIRGDIVALRYDKRI
jgi:DNA-binding GntR family transcriptional regulator